MKFFLKYLLIVLIPFTLKGQGFDVENFLVKEGLAQSQVFALMMDSRAYLWAGTQGGGLSRFDGNSFQTFYTKNGNYIHALAENQEGLIWIGSDRGLTSYDGFEFITHLENELKSVNTIFYSKKSELWIGAKNGLWVLRNENWINPTRTHGFSNLDVKCFFEDSTGKIWVGTQKGILIFENDKLDWLDPSFGLNGEPVSAIAQDGSGGIWIGTASKGIQVLIGNTRNTIDVIDGISSNNINCLLKDDDDRMWIGTRDAGVSIWLPDDGSIRYLQEHDGLEASDIRQILQDDWGNIWLGSSGGGLAKCTEANFPFEYYGTSEGLYEREVYAVSEDEEKNLWLATGNGLFKKIGNSFEKYAEGRGFISEKSLSLLHDQKGRLWIGSENHGPILYEDNQFKFLNKNEVSGRGAINAIEEDAFGNIWFAVDGKGIFKLLEQDTIHVYYDKVQLDSMSILLGGLSKSDSLLFRRDSVSQTTNIISMNEVVGINDKYVNCLFSNLGDEIWYGSQDGRIGGISNDSLHYQFNELDGIPIRSITSDGAEKIWIGTASRGIYKVDFFQDSFYLRNYTKEEGLHSDNIYLIQFDEQKSLWAGNQSGVDQLQFDEAGNIKTIRSFGIAEGFEGGETCQNAVLNDREGNLWFGTRQGLMQYIPGRSYYNSVAPTVHLSAVQLFYKNLAETDYAAWVHPWKGLKENLLLPHNQNSLGFEFLGINHSTTAKVKYQWKLGGYESDWSPIVDKTNVNYSNLPPGIYNFQLRAYNESEVFNETPINVSFEIEKPYWEKWWFRLGLITAILILFTSIFKWRINRERQRSNEEKERLELEKNLLLLEQKALQLQMNPHFIFNALNSIQNLIGQQDNQKARYNLAKFSKLMRLTLENSRENTIPLEQEIKALENYLALEQFSRGNHFDYEIVVDELLDEETVHIPPMLIQPFVENAIIHGVAHIQHQGKITVEFKEKEAKLICQVTDNGIGRAKAKTIKSQIDHQHKSVALQVTKERLDNLFPGRGYTDSLVITDLHDEENNIVGTKVRVVLPMLIK